MFRDDSFEVLSQRCSINNKEVIVLFQGHALCILNLIQPEQLRKHVIASAITITRDSAMTKTSDSAIAKTRASAIAKTRDH